MFHVKTVVFIDLQKNKDFISADKMPSDYI